MYLIKNKVRKNKVKNGYAHSVFEKVKALNPRIYAIFKAFTLRI